jgi:glycosyltransferase involved in cell wall biosynthesis
MKKISVIIPAYNHAQYIGEAISSVMESEYQNFEIVVIDDGSTDSTRNVVSSFSGVRYFHQQNSGAHAAINRGISLSSGDLIAILNDDDKYTKDHLSKAMSNMTTYGNSLFVGIPIVFGRGQKLDDFKNHIIQSKIYTEKFGLGRSLLELNWSTSTSSFVFEKDLFLKLGGFHNFTMCHDLDFLLRAIFMEGAHIGVSEVPTWFYRCHETNSGSSISSRKQNAEIVYCLGKVLDSIFESFSAEELSKIIGYGLDPELISFAARKKPWANELSIGTDESIQEWISLCVKGFG